MKLKRTLVASVLLSSSIAMADEPGGLLLTIGGSGYYVQNNQVNLPISYGSGFNSYYYSQQQDSTNFSNYGLTPNIGIQYRLDCSNVILGANLSYLDNSYFKGNSFNDVTGYYWRISGGDMPENDSFANYIDSEYVHQKQSILDSQAFIKFQEYYGDKVIFTPKVGFSFNKNYNSYDYVINGRMYGPTNTPYTTTGNQVLNTDYLGPVFGLKVEYQINNRFNVFADGDVSVLYAHSSMKADKNMSVSIYGPTEEVTDSKNKLDGRYKLTVGVDIITDTMFPDYSPKLTLFAGVDVWQYSPEIVNPNGSNQEETHIESRTSFNKVAGLIIKLPIN